VASVLVGEKSGKKYGKKLNIVQYDAEKTSD
jgi:hypothetical protein